MLDRSIVKKSLLLLLRPIIGFCLRHALRIQDVIDCVKAVYLELSKDQLQQSEDKVTVSRLSAMTGMHRRDVMLYQSSESFESETGDLITRILGHWQTDRTFLNSKGKPRVLSLESKSAEFGKLVKKVSQDVNPATVLFELERIKAIEHVPGGVKLAVQSYSPQGDVLEGIRILANDCRDLIEAVEENLLQNATVPNLHARTTYDRIREDSLLELKRWIVREGHRFHSQVRERLAEADQEINPDPCYKGNFARVTVQSFSHIKSNIRKKN